VESLRTPPQAVGDSSFPNTANGDFHQKRSIAMKKTLTLAICVLFLGNVALADWDVNDPAKWVQMPNVGAGAMDVLVV